MDVGTLLSAVQTLFAALQCTELKQLYSISAYKRELENLEQTVSTIKAVLQDAESKKGEDELSHQAQLWIEELKDAVYDADDLIDEFVTLAEQKKLIKGGNVSQKVHRLFSRLKSLAVAHKMSRGVEEIRNKLNAIAMNHNQFGFKIDVQSTRRRREETCSYVYAQDIIGREDDLERIAGRLLNLDVQQDVSCLSIVGIGGLGKTTLAQLIYNDPRIEQEFPVRLWTCISDEESWDLKAIICKILESAKREKHEFISMDLLQEELRQQVVGKKFLLVLDDIWNEDRHKWLKLMEFLMRGLRGSWVIVTTRSRETSRIVGGEVHHLQGLSNEDSWLLFEKTAFGEDHDQTDRLELDQIGRELIKQCANVPLAIRVVGTSLYGKDKKTWLSFQEFGLRRIVQGTNGIKPILKLSYLHLEPQLRTCFSYCALFPKDFVIKKETLIHLWIAQGYVIPLDKGQSIEYAGEEYFNILLKRCFFQDVQKNLKDEIVACKIHDLMHDLAQEVAGNEIPESNGTPSNLNTEIRHLVHPGWCRGIKSLFTGTKIRTYLRVGNSRPESPEAFGTLLANWISLRALDLSYSGMTNLPNTLGKLLHLRYLDLSNNHVLELLPDSIGELHNLQILHLSWCNKLKELPSTLGKLVHLRYLDLSENYTLEVLPDSIGKLHKLQILQLSKCRKLKELPKDLSKMTRLRVLDITRCESLTHIPRGVGKLSCLWKLPFFVVGEKTSSMEELQLADQLEELKALHELKGDLCIQMYIPTNAKYAMESGRKGECLSQHLTKIVITFPKRKFEDVQTRVYDIDEALLEDLQPHSNLRGLELKRYCGGRMPTWARKEDLTNLVNIKIDLCFKMQHMSGLGKLSKLKSLELFRLYELEYIENTLMSRNSAGVRALESEELFFPSLEKLQLANLPKLKGWWRDDNNTLLPSFPCLSELEIWNCSNLASMPLCPSVEELTLVNYNVNLRIMESIEPGNSKLRWVKTNKVGYLKLVLSMEAFQRLKAMEITKEMESLSQTNRGRLAKKFNTSLIHYWLIF